MNCNNNNKPKAISEADFRHTSPKSSPAEITKKKKKQGDRESATLM
jgi:hypothetical protein